MIYALKIATGLFPVSNEFKDGKESSQKRQ